MKCNFVAIEQNSQSIFSVNQILVEKCLRPDSWNPHKCSLDESARKTNGEGLFI
jgi:hypothetical protein